MFNDTAVLTTHKHQTKTHTQTETWTVAACFLVFPSPCRAAKALEALVIPSVSICIVSKTLEQRLWPFNVKGIDVSDAL